MNANIKVLSVIICLSLFINPVWAFHTVHTDEVDFIIQPDDHDNVGYFNIVNGSQAYLHNTYGTNATELLGNVTADTDTDIITSHAFLDNDLEETMSVVEVYDDDETFWSLYLGGAGIYGGIISEETTIKHDGTSSINITVTSGVKSLIGVTHTYGGGQDWSLKDYICSYFYGTNTGVTWTLQVRSAGANFNLYSFTDDYSGWERHVFALNDPISATGALDLSAVTSLYFYTNPAGVESINYFDRLIVDVGQWVGVEISVPDTLNGLVRNVRLFAWDGSAYDATAFMSWDAENDSPSESWDDSVLHLLDTTTIDNIYTGDIWDYMDSFLKGLRFATKDTVHVSSSNVIVYSDLKGVAYRVGFAVKMPPDDGLDSASAGLSQLRFKADIYYDSNGETTVIHEGDEDSASAGYGGSVGFLIASVIGFSVIIMGVTRKR